VERSAVSSPWPLLRAITTLPFVISTGAQRSGEISVWMLCLGNVFDRTYPDFLFRDAVTTVFNLSSEQWHRIVQLNEQGCSQEQITFL
jgi:hypothetical protein